MQCKLETPRLPPEIHWKVMIFLPYESLLEICKTNKEYQSICSDNVFWLEKIKQDFPYRYKYVTSSYSFNQDTKDWRKEYDWSYKNQESAKKRDRTIDYIQEAYNQGDHSRFFRYVNEPETYKSAWKILLTDKELMKLYLDNYRNRNFDFSTVENYYEIHGDDENGRRIINQALANGTEPYYRFYELLLKQNNLPLILELLSHPNSHPETVYQAAIETGYNYTQLRNLVDDVEKIICKDQNCLLRNKFSLDMSVSSMLQTNPKLALEYAINTKNNKVLTDGIERINETYRNSGVLFNRITLKQYNRDFTDLFLYLLNNLPYWQFEKLFTGMDSVNYLNHYDAAFLDRFLREGASLLPAQMKANIAADLYEPELLRLYLTEEGIDVVPIIKRISNIVKQDFHIDNERVLDDSDEGILIIDILINYLKKHLTPCKFSDVMYNLANESISNREPFIIWNLYIKNGNLSKNSLKDLLLTLLENLTEDDLYSDKYIFTENDIIYFQDELNLKEEYADIRRNPIADSLFIEEILHNFDEVGTFINGHDEPTDDEILAMQYGLY